MLGLQYLTETHVARTSTEVGCGGGSSEEVSGSFVCSQELGFTMQVIRSRDILGRWARHKQICVLEWSLWQFMEPGLKRHKTG